MTDQGIKAKVINRQMLTDNVMEFSIETYQEVKVIPGQWALFLFEDEQGPFQRRHGQRQNDAHLHHQTFGKRKGERHDQEDTHRKRGNYQMNIR